MYVYKLKIKMSSANNDENPDEEMGGTSENGETMADIAAAQTDRFEFGKGYDISFFQSIRVCVLQFQLFLYCFLFCFLFLGEISRKTEEKKKNSAKSNAISGHTKLSNPSSSLVGF